MHHVHQFVDEVTLTRCQLIWRRERRRRQQERGKKTSDKRGAHSGSFGESNVVRAQMIVLNNRTVPSNVRDERPEPASQLAHARCRAIEQQRALAGVARERCGAPKLFASLAEMS